MIYVELSDVEMTSILLSDEYARWSREAAEFLVEYLNELDGDIAFDKVALRCDWSEMTEEEIIDAYGSPDSDFESVIDDVRDNHYVMELENGKFMVNVN